MDKEYLPAIALFILSAIALVAAAVLLILDHTSWATWLLGGVAIMLVASSKLVKIGKALQEREENEEEDK